MNADANSANVGTNHISWNKGRLIGPKLPLKPREIWAIRIRLQFAKRAGDLALFIGLIEENRSNSSHNPEGPDRPAG